MAFVDTSSEVIREMKNAGRRACRKIAKTIADDMVEHAPDKRGLVRKTFKYGASISSHTGQPSGKVGYLSKRKQQALGIKFKLNGSWLEFGTKPHIIEAGGKRRDGEKRIWLTNKSSGVRFGRTVKHPGSKGLGLLSSAAQRVDGPSIAEAELKFLSSKNEELIRMRDDGNDDID